MTANSAFIACDFYPKGYSISLNKRLLEQFKSKYDSTNLLSITCFDCFFDKPSSTQTKYRYDIYVLEASSDQILPDSLLPDKGVMPRSWERGYSRGIVLNKEKRSAFYWLIYW